MIPNTTTQNEHSEALHRREEEAITVENVMEVKGTRFYERTHGDVGYYRINDSDSGSAERLTNFIIRFNKQTRRFLDGKNNLFFVGELIISDSEAITFDDFQSSNLVHGGKLKEYITTLAGTKAFFHIPDNIIMELIKMFNCTVEEELFREFGYDESRERYFTSDQIITANDIKEKQTPIDFTDVGNRNYLGFKLDEKVDISSSVEALRQIKDLFDEEVFIPVLSFSMLPVIWPYIRDISKGKPYMMLKGVTGCGKTTLAGMMQNLYGDFDVLETWTSTMTAVTIRGHAFKDSLYVVDDLKEQNIISKDSLTRMIQNYYDENARNRATAELNLMDNRFIKGCLLISAEDLVLNQASSIARGIIIPMGNHPINREKIMYATRQSKYLRLLTAEYIKYVISQGKGIDWSTTFNDSFKHYEEIMNRNRISGDNLPRQLNNIVILRTSLQLLKEYLHSLNVFDILIEEDWFRYDIVLENAFLDNANRLKTQNPVAKFEETMYEMIDTGLIYFENIDKKSDTPKREKCIGYFDYDKDGKLKLHLKLTYAYKLINNYLLSEGGIGATVENLKGLLASQGKIRMNKSGNVSFGQGRTERGVLWTGEINKDLFGIPDSESELEYEIDHQSSFGIENLLPG